jgi:hypothetical protein
MIPGMLIASYSQSAAEYNLLLKQYNLIPLDVRTLVQPPGDGYTTKKMWTTLLICVFFLFSNYISHLDTSTIIID